jgi:chromosome segregation ATPase
MGNWFFRLMLAVAVAVLAGYGAYFYREEYRPLKHEAEELRARLGQLSSQCAASEQERQRQVGALQKSLAELKTSVTGAETALEQARAESGKCAAERSEIKSHAAELESARQADQKNLQYLSQVRVAAQREIADVQVRHTEALQQLQTALREKDAIIQELQTRLSHLAKDSAEKQKAKESLEQDVERLKTALDASRARSYALEQAQLKKQQVLEAQQEQGVDELQQKDKMIQDLLGRVASLERERSGLTRARSGEARKAQENLDSLKRAAAASKQKAEALAEEVAGLRRQLAGSPGPHAATAEPSQQSQPTSCAQLQEGLVQRERRIQQLNRAVAGLEREKSAWLETKQRLSQEVLRCQPTSAQ